MKREKANIKNQKTQTNSKELMTETNVEEEKKTRGILTLKSIVECLKGERDYQGRIV